MNVVMPDETTIVISFHLFIIVEICLAVGVGAQAQGVLIMQFITFLE
jgi:hypothetical protein